MDRDARPVTVAATTAVVSCGLLAVAISRGWLGPDVGRGANFCEAGRDGYVRQPANTFSNVGFIVAGLAIGWHAGARANRRLFTAVACLVVLLGPGSAAMHATQSDLGGHLDMLSMYLVASFALAYAMMRRLGGGPGLLAALFTAGVAFCEVVGAWPVTLPVLMHPGNAAFALLLVAATGLEVSLDRGGAARRFGYGALAALLAGFAIWNASKTWLCAPHSLIQGHAIWHLLCALSAYFLYRYYAYAGVSCDTPVSVRPV